MKPYTVLLVAWLAAVWCGVAEAGTPQFRPLGFLSTQPYSVASGVSADGSVVVGQSTNALGEPEAFRWTPEKGMIGLGMASASAVSPDGAVVVGTGPGGKPYRWTAAGGVEDLAALSGCAGWGRVMDVSADGSTVVGDAYSSAHGCEEAFRWRGDTGMIGLGDLPGRSTYSTARDVSTHGSVVVGVSESDINPEAQIFEVFRWTQADGIKGIGVAAFDGASRVSVSRDGSVIVGDNIYRESYVWTAEHGAILLKDILGDPGGTRASGWQAYYATAASEDGRTIVGYGTNPQGQTEAWLLVVPEPASLLLLAAAVPWLLLVRRWRIGRGRSRPSRRLVRATHAA